MPSPSPSLIPSGPPPLGWPGVEPLMSEPALLLKAPVMAPLLVMVALPSDPTPEPLRPVRVEAAPLMTVMVLPSPALIA